MRPEKEPDILYSRLLSKPWAAPSPDHRFVVALPQEWSHLVVHKGFVCIDGMSLTIAELGADRMTFWITPHTFAVTNLCAAKPGDLINLEFDMLAKHIERLVSGGADSPGLG